MQMTALRHPAPPPRSAPRTLATRPAPTLDVIRGLGLDPLELEAAIRALDDRGELAAPDDRARLARARTALELELSRVIGA